MVLTEQEKKVLLERLKAGREKKRAERAAVAKQQKSKEEVVSAPPAVEAVIEQAPAPVVPLAPSQTQDAAPVSAHEVRRNSKKVAVTSSDSDSDSSIDNKDKKTKKKPKRSAYMKIKIYSEPKYPAALQALVGSLQEEEPALPVERAPSPPKRVTNVIPKQKFSAPIVRENTMRRLAMDIFG